LGGTIKEAASYQFTIYVQQPQKGSNQETSGPKFAVGHAFIKLTKTNSDGTRTEAVFGFYPANDQGWDAGSPMKNNIKSSFGNDDGHPYTESVSKGITAGQFNSILKKAEDYEKTNYNVATNNCTNFALDASKMAGLNLPETKVEIPSSVVITKLV
jgi:hypothetical protein